MDLSIRSLPDTFLLDVASISASCLTHLGLASPGLYLRSRELLTETAAPWGTSLAADSISPNEPHSKTAGFEFPPLEQTESMNFSDTV